MKIKRLICMLLSITLVGGAIPAMAFASEGEKEPIYTIEINDLTIPKEGEEPDYDVSIPSEKGYHIHNDSENSNEKNGVVWDELVSDLEANVLRPGESVFESGKRYIASISIAADDEYWFEQNEYGAYTTNAYINGIPATVSGIQDKDREKFLSVSIMFDVLKEYDLIVEGGEAYNDNSNKPTEAEWEPIDSAPAGAYVQVRANKIDGWEFDHWELVEGDIDNFIDRSNTFFMMPECDVRMRAFFKQVDGDEVATFHVVTYKFGDSPIATQDIKNGDYAIQPEDPYQEGKIFMGWYTDDGQKYDFSTPVTKNINLTAKFVNEDEVHEVFLYFGNTPIAGQLVIHGETAVEPEDPYQEGKIFMGWYTDDGQKYDFSTPVTKNINLTAVFKVKECAKHTWDVGKVTKKATCTVNGSKKFTCKICGKTKTSVINKASGVKLSVSSYVYNGKVKSPTVIVKDSKGNVINSANYTIARPVGRKNVGKYVYKITFKNQYSGTKSLTLTINPKGTSISSLTKASKAFTVKWKKQATQTTGYQICYGTSTNKNYCKKVLISSNKTLSKKVTGLKRGKKYYVWVRTYKTVNGTKYYSAWSARKSVTTK